MKVSCPACDSKYTIADEKVAGRKVKVRCKSCGGQILINGTIPPPAPDGDVDDGAAVDAKSDRGSSSTVPKKDAAKSSPTSSSPASEPVVDDAIIWSVNVSEADERSLKTHEVVAGFLSGEFAGEVYVWHDGLADWCAIPDVPELAAAIAAAQEKKSSPGAAPAPKPKTLPSAGKGVRQPELATSGAPAELSKKTAARAAGAKRPQSAHDLFAAASTAGSETDVPVATDDEDAAQKRTGARNENSVLFSLDALKAGITAAPAQQPGGKPGGAKKAPATPRKKLEDLMVTSAALPTGPAASPMMLNANQALLTAPAPPPPPPKPEPVAAVDSAAASAAAIIYAKEKEKTKRMLIGVIAAIVAIGAIAGIAIGMTKNRGEPAAQPSAAGPTVSAVAAAPTTAPTTAPEPVKTAEPPTSESAAPGTSAAPGQKPVAVASIGPKTGGGTATATTPRATDTKKDPPKKDDPAPVPISSGAGSFNKDAASQALAVAASQTSICKKSDGPTGQGKVQVTFAPSGRATTANIVAGPFAGTAVGGCVSGVFKRAKVPPFSGDAVTVSKSFSIVP